MDLQHIIRVTDAYIYECSHVCGQVWHGAFLKWIDFQERDSRGRCGSDVSRLRTILSAVEKNRDVSVCVFCANYWTDIHNHDAAPSYQVLRRAIRGDRTPPRRSLCVIRAVFTLTIPYVRVHACATYYIYAFAHVCARVDKERQIDQRDARYPDGRR